MLTKILNGTLLIAFALLPTMALAQPMPPGKWWHIPRLSDQIDLNADEKLKMDGLYAESRRRLIDLKRNVEREQFELENVLETEPLDEAQVMLQSRKLEEARGQLATERLRFLVEVRKILGLERFQHLKRLIHREFGRRRPHPP